MSFSRILTLFLLLEISILIIGYSLDGANIVALQTITRFSGRLSLLVFSIIFLFQGDREKLSKWLSPKYYLLFAIVHGIHLVELLILNYLNHSSWIVYRLLGGVAAYVIIFVMPLLHYQYKRGVLHEKIYHFAEIVYDYYVWLIFFMTYLSRVQGSIPTSRNLYYEYIFLLGWVSLLLGQRLSRALKWRG